MDIESTLKTILEELQQIKNNLFILQASLGSAISKKEAITETTLAPKDKPVQEERKRGEAQVVKGWKLQHRKIGNKRYWYARKIIDNKLKSIYIGKELEQAFPIIEAWEKSQGVSLPKTEKIKFQKSQEVPKVPFKPEEKPKEAPKPEEKLQEKSFSQLTFLERMKRAEALKVIQTEMFERVDNPPPSIEKKSSQFIDSFNSLMNIEGWKFTKPNIHRKGGHQFELISNDMGLLRVGARKKKQKVIISAFTPEKLADYISISTPEKNPIIVTDKKGKVSKKKY